MKLHITTPLIESAELSRLYGGKVLLKLENLQPSGSFKNRGIRYLAKQFATTTKGFISFSGGNAGLALAYAGRLLNRLCNTFSVNLGTSEAKKFLISRKSA